MKRHTSLFKRTFLALIFAIAALSMAGLAVAQDNPFEAQTGEKKEAKLKDFERKDKKRSTLADEEGGAGPRVEREKNVAGWERSKLQYQDKAIRLMERRVEAASDEDDDYPDLLFRLSEMYWQKAQYHELEAVDLLFESRDLEDAGNASGAEEARRKEAENTKTVEEYRIKTIEIYAKIITEFPLYENTHKILFFLAFNLQEMGKGEDAVEFYKQLIREYPDSEYVAQAYLGLAEWTYIQDDMNLALEQYQNAQNSAPGTPTAGFAMYKMGWCYFNLGEPKKALAQFKATIEYADGKDDQLRKEALKDLVKAYSLWDDAKPSKAKKFIGKFTRDDEELNSMMERLARLYGEDGKVEESNYTYNQLIKTNKDKFKIVGYQIEIMLNVETLNDPNKTAESIMRTVRLFNSAKDAGLEGATPEKIEEYYKLLEEYTRETAKWYHLTAQTTKNAVYYGLAYEIYHTYVENFPEAADNYEMMYYYAELLYWKKNYPDAAKRYDQVISIKADGEYSKDAAYGAVLSYSRVAETPDVCEPIPVTPEPKPGEAPTFPEYEIPECRTKLIAAADRYVELVPKGEYVVDIKYTAARVYYDYNHFEKAFERFADIAENNSDHRLAIIAANLLLDTLNIRKDYKRMWEWVGKLKADPNLYRPPLADTLDTFEVQLAFKFCNDHEESKDWKTAAECFEEFATNFGESEFAARALWSASVAWENASEVGKAIETRIRLLREHGDDEDLAPRSLYAIGQNFHGIAVYSEAARFYELFVEKFPRNKTACVEFGQESEVSCSMFALQNAAAFRSGLGDYEEAVRDFDLYTEMFPADKEQISQLKFNTGRIYFDQGLYDKAIERYEEYIQRHAKEGPPSRHVAALAAIGRSNWRKNARTKGVRYFEKAEEMYNSKKFKRWYEGASDEHKREATEAAAEARFMRGEFIFNKALAIQISDDTLSPSKMERHLQRQLKKKNELMQEAIPLYEQVIVQFQTPKWGLAALCRLGMMFHDVGTQIQNAPIPTRLDEDQSLIYEDLLLEFSGEFENKAITFYVTAVTKAAELGWFSDYTTIAQRRLFDLRPDEYRSASEIKAQPNKGYVGWHRASLYDDIEAAEGKKLRKKRGTIDLESGEMNKVKGEGAEGAETSQAEQ